MDTFREIAWAWVTGCCGGTLSCLAFPILEPGSPCPDLFAARSSLVHTEESQLGGVCMRAETMVSVCRQLRVGDTPVPERRTPAHRTGAVPARSGVVAAAHRLLEVVKPGGLARRLLLGRRRLGGLRNGGTNRRGGGRHARHTQSDSLSSAPTPSQPLICVTLEDFA